MLISVHTPNFLNDCEKRPLSSSDFPNPLDHITTVRPLAKSLFKSLFSSSEMFGQIRDQLGLLVAVLDEIEPHTQGAHAGNEQIPGLKEALDNCHNALDDLSHLKDHFDGVPPQTRVTWERMGWADDELMDLSSKLTTYINGLNVLNANMIRSSHENIERLLRDFMNDIRTGKRESSAMSILSSGSLSRDEKEKWRELRRELQSIDITPEIFAQNREFILDTLRALSQNETGWFNVDLATLEEEQSSTELTGDVADGFSELESHEETPSEPLSEISDGSSKWENQGDMAPLPGIRPSGPANSEAHPHVSSKESPREESSDECVYEGYTFFKADPISETKATWIRVERTRIHLPQRDIYRMVRKRAHKISAATQYGRLSELRQAHVNQLIAERRMDDPFVEWSCVYAKERARPAKNRDTLSPVDYVILSMDVILMKRPIETRTHFRTPMGDLVDLGINFPSNRIETKELSTPLFDRRREETISKPKPTEFGP